LLNLVPPFLPSDLRLIPATASLCPAPHLHPGKIQ
jgi:hypothetical protein